MAFSNATRSLKVFLSGDTRDLEKALARAEYKMKRFNQGAGGAATRGLGGGGVLSMLGGKGGLVAAGAGAAALGLRSVTNAARDAEIVLGQTSLAVENVGLSWQANSKRIDAAATRISKASSFDDEAVLQSFAVFVRNQKDVGKSLELTALAADVARGNFKDLAWGTTIVNKAAMGQIGALRRANIQIDKNATATEALALLQRNFGGAAKTYSDSAAGAQDRLRVSVENLQESLGKGLTPALAEVVKNLADGVDAANAFGSALGNIKIPGGGSIRGAFLDALFLGPNALRDLLNGSNGSTTTAGPAGPVGTQARVGAPFGITGPSKQPKLITRMSTRLDAQFARAQRTAGTKDDLAALAKMKTFLESALKQTNLKPGQRTALEQALTGVVNQIQGIYDDQAQAAQDVRDEARRKAQEAKQKQKDKLRDALNAATTFADNLKQGALSLLDRRQGKVDWQRALVDAKEQLKLAKMIGGPAGIREAQRNLTDAELAQKRWIAEGAVAKAGTANSATFVINGMTINGVQNVKQLIEEINKAAKRTAGQSRGPVSNSTLVH